MASLIKVFARYAIARAIANGDTLDYARLDGMFADFGSAINTLVDRTNGVTNADGTLKNVPSAIALGLVGTQQFTATASQTVFTSTTIVWDSSMSNLSVDVYSGGTRLAPSTVTVANASGYLRVTITAQTVSTIVVMSAYTVGAGISSDLASTASGKGASLIGIQDADSLFVATTVETALAETANALATLITSIGSIATYIRRDGSVAFTANQPMGNFKLTGLAAGSVNGDSVRYEQLQAYVNSLNAISSTFLPLAGGTMTGDILLGGHRITGAAVPVDDSELVRKDYVDDALSNAQASLIAPVGSITMFAASVIPSGWLECDGAAVSRSTYAALFAAISTTFGAGDASTTFNVPDLKGRVAVGAGTGTSDGVTGLTLTAGGSGYTSAPTVTISGNGSAGATAYATVSGGAVVTVVLLTRGTGCTAAPTVAFSGGGGTGATATASVTLTARTTATKIGEESHIQVEAELAKHTHDLAMHSNLTNNGTDSAATGDDTLSIAAGDRLTSTGNNTAMNTMQPSIVLKFLIKT